jgi:catechol 2,3-dioxygenase-like lactoylglutathione lyase family enzyme
MGMRLASAALVVRDYDEAIYWFTGKLGFVLAEDTDWGGGKRWVRVSAPGGGSDLLLAKAITAEQTAQIGNTGGGRVCFFLHTDDFWRDYQAIKGKGVTFAEEPRDEPYGWVVVFLDLYGNKWDLVGLHDATVKDM